MYIVIRPSEVLYCLLCRPDQVIDTSFKKLLLLVKKVKKAFHLK